MGVFFSELAKKLAERWVALLLVPGALLVLSVVVAVRLGHRKAVNPEQLRRIAADVAEAVSRQSAGDQILMLVAVLLAAAGTGLVVQALVGVTRLVWLGRWPQICGPLQRQLIPRRRTRWHRLLTSAVRWSGSIPREDGGYRQQEEIHAVAARMVGIALAEPGRATWMGDRVHAVEQVAFHRYGLDLTFGWPRLWLVLPDNARAEITAAEAANAASAVTGSWAWPYLALGVVWWPAALIGVGVGISGWVRARGAVADLAALSEAAVDLYGRALAAALGVGAVGALGPLTVREGREITAIVRKGR